MTIAIDAEGYQAITNAFKGGYEQFQAICKAFSELPQETVERARLSQRSSSPDQVERPSVSSLTAVLTSIVPDQDVLKAMKLLFLNTQLKVVALSVPSALDSRGASKNPSSHSLTAYDNLTACIDDLEVRHSRLIKSTRHFLLMLPHHGITPLFLSYTWLFFFSLCSFHCGMPSLHWVGASIRSFWCI